MQIDCIFAKDYEFDNIIWFISKKILKWHVTQLVNTCCLNNMTIFSIINSHGTVNSFLRWRSQILKVLIIHCKYERILFDYVSCIFRNFEWLVISESWYFTNKYILFKSRNILIMIFGNFIYPPDMKKVKAFWYLFN